MKVSERGQPMPVVIVVGIAAAGQWEFEKRGGLAVLVGEWLPFGAGGPFSAMPENGGQQAVECDAPGAGEDDAVRGLWR